MPEPIPKKLLEQVSEICKSQTSLLNERHLDAIATSSPAVRIAELEKTSQLQLAALESLTTLSLSLWHFSNDRLKSSADQEWLDHIGLVLESVSDALKTK